MPQYLVAIHRPDGYDPAVAEDEAMGHDIDGLNDDMVAAGAVRPAPGVLGTIVRRPSENAAARGGGRKLDAMR